MTPGFDDGPARGLAFQPRETHQHDQRHAQIAGMRIHESQKAQFAQRIAAIAGEGVGEIMHVAHAVAEQHHVVRHKVVAIGLRRRHQSVGRQILRRHEAVIVVTQAARGHRGKRGAVGQSGEQAALLHQDAGAHGALPEAVEQGDAGTAAHGAQDHKDFLRRFGIRHQAADGLDGLNRAEPSIEGGLRKHRQLPCFDTGNMSTIYNIVNSEKQIWPRKNYRAKTSGYGAVRPMPAN